MPHFVHKIMLHLPETRVTLFAMNELVSSFCYEVSFSLFMFSRNSKRGFKFKN